MAVPIPDTNKAIFLEVEKAPTELTPEMLATGAWRTTQLRPYNLAALGLEPTAGCLHPLLKVGRLYNKSAERERDGASMNAFRL